MTKFFPRFSRLSKNKQEKQFLNAVVSSVLMHLRKMSNPELQTMGLTF